MSAPVAPAVPDPLMLSQLAESQAIQREYEARMQDLQREMQEREDELWRREQRVAEKEAEHERLFALAQRLGARRADSIVERMALIEQTAHTL